VERTDDSLPCAQQALPAKQLALDRLGKTIFSNTIVVGAMAKLLSERLKKETVLESLLVIIPKFQNENRIAFEVGYNAMTKAAAA
jgi:2-oxoglutarate ferredoxin oxidoreductase subunit gamma